MCRITNGAKSKKVCISCSTKQLTERGQDGNLNYIRQTNVAPNVTRNVAQKQSGRPQFLKRKDSFQSSVKLPSITNEKLNRDKVCDTNAFRPIRSSRSPDLPIVSIKSTYVPLKSRRLPDLPMGTSCSPVFNRDDFNSTSFINKSILLFELKQDCCEDASDDEKDNGPEDLVLGLGPRLSESAMLSRQEREPDLPMGASSSPVFHRDFNSTSFINKSILLFELKQDCCEDASDDKKDNGPEDLVLGLGPRLSESVMLSRQEREGLDDKINRFLDSLEDWK